jgi:hypothetical protein
VLLTDTEGEIAFDILVFFYFECVEFGLVIASSYYKSLRRQT